MINKPYIIAQVLNMNGLELLKNCIPLLIAQDYENLKIVLIDNGSDDGSLEFILENYPLVEIIKNEENVGLAKARNKGFQSAIQQKADFVITLDNDTFLVNNNTISSLVRSITDFHHENVFAFGVRIKEGINHSIINDGQILFKKQSDKGFYFNMLRHNQQIEDYETNFRYVDFVSGCFMMINTNLLKKTGFLDERYYIYFEEADLCMRGWIMGFPSIVFTDISVHHLKTVTNVSWSAFYTYYTIRNFLVFSKSYLKNASHKNLFRYLRIKKANGYAFIALRNSIKQKSFKSVLKSVFYAFYDYSFNKNRNRY